METAALLAFAFIAWILMGRSMVAAATLATFIPFVTLSFDPNASPVGNHALSGMSGIKGMMRFVGALLFCLQAISNRQIFKGFFRGPALLALLFFGWALLGITHSADPFISVVRICEWFVFFIGALVIHEKVTRRGGPIALVKFLLLGLSPLLALILFMTVINPDATFETRSVDGLSRLGGNSMDPNSIGALGGLLGIGSITLWRLTRQRYRNSIGVVPLFTLGVALYILLITRSRTALVAFTTASGSLIWFSAQKNRIVRARLILLCLVGVCVILFNYQRIFEWTLRGDDVATLVSGTGRSDLWIGLLTEAFPKRPLLGHGYMMLGEFGPYMDNGYPWTNAHNAFIFALVSTGIVGFILTVWMTLIGLRSALGKRFLHDPNRALWIAHQGLSASFLLILMDAMANYGMVGHPTAAMFVYLILFVYAFPKNQTP